MDFLAKISKLYLGVVAVFYIFIGLASLPAFLYFFFGDVAPYVVVVPLSYFEKAVNSPGPEFDWNAIFIMAFASIILGIIFLVSLLNVRKNKSWLFPLYIISILAFAISCYNFFTLDYYYINLSLLSLVYGISYLLGTIFINISIKRKSEEI